MRQTANDNGANLHNTVLLPAGFALALALAASIAAGVFTWYLKLGSPLVASLLVGVVVYIGSFVWVARDMVSRYTPPPPTPPAIIPATNEQTVETLRLEIAHGMETPYPSLAWVDLPRGITREQLVRTCKLIAAGRTFATHALSGGGRPLTRNQFERLRDDLFIPAGWARWRSDKSNSQGCELTRAGERMVGRIATSIDYPDDNNSGLPYPFDY